ncbi:MAG: hypothetical protein QOF98_1912 [Streptomyces sp.]|jgi:hypothetical protein|nr:hypothetical protein [Streptomyces sp.]
MKSFFGRAFTWLRDTVSGRRRLARYNHPGAHRGSAPDRDAMLAKHHRPTDIFPGGM